jgi:hypothetical protein
MRSPYIALGLVFLLSACESPTGPEINPNIDGGSTVPRAEPNQNPGGCLKKRAPAKWAAAQIPTCRVDPGKNRAAK